MVKILSLPIHLRPREKLIAKGPANLTDRELLAILLRTGTSKHSALDLAAEILRKHNLTKLLYITLDDLQQIKGIGSEKAVTILGAFELTRRATKSFDNSLPVISCPQDAVDQLTDIRSKKKEHFVVLYLNARNQLIHREIISIGTLTASLVHPREVFEPAISNFAASVMLAHNHPSGDPQPSVEDLKITTRIIDSGSILAIKVLDHLIITPTLYYSLREHGELS